MDTLHKQVWFAGALGLSLAVAGCTSGGGSSSGGGSGGTMTAASKPKPVPGTTAAAVATLQRADTCGDLLDKIQSDVIAKIDAQAALLKTGPQQNNNYYRGGPVFAGGVDVAQPGVANAGMGTASGPGVSSGGAAGTGASGAPVPSNGGTGTSTSGNQGTGGTSGSKDLGGTPTTAPTGHSDTNTQVAGVDEADIVKTDEKGEKIFLIHGNTLFRLTSWPPASTAIEDQAPIEGSASELFVAGGKAVVFSTIWNQGDIVALDAKGDTYGGGAYYQPYFYGAPFTKITTIDVSGKTPKVERELYVEGSYLSSRRHDTTVRAIVQGGFHTPPVFNAYIEYTDPWGEAYPQADIDAQVDAWRDRVVTSVEHTKIGDWVPVERERVNGKIVEAKPRCLDFYAPPPALTSYGLTNVVSFDMSDAKSDIGGAIILGNADTVYANDDTLVLAQRDWRYDQGFLQREQTVLHTFDLTATATKYHASGFVPGHILNQFALDVAGSTLRVSITQNIWQNFVELIPLKTNLADVPMAEMRKQTDNRVIALQPDGHDLQRVGITTPLGADGESIQATRFVGDRGYVTTFRQTDPLTAIDLSDPKNLKILGELSINGFSEYMQPIDANHLLTIGRNADSTGRDIGLMLEIFDVTDAVHPKLSSKYGFEPSGWSEASNNHKAFTYWVPKGETDGLLAIPYVNYTAGVSSSLQVFRVSTSKGFTQLGAIDHTPFFGVCYDQLGQPTTQYYGYYYCQQPEVRRGLFIQDMNNTYVYSISYAGILVHDLTDLTKALASVTLPPPDYADHREGEILPTVGGGGMTSMDTGVGGTGTASGGSAGAPADAGVDTKPVPAADGGMAMPAP